MRRRSFALIALAAGCATAGSHREPPGLTEAGEPLRSLLRSQPELGRHLQQAAERRIQIVLGVVEPGTEGRPTLRQVGYRSGAEYFYPASSIKTFAAVAALERLAELRRETGLPIDRDTPLHLHPLFAGEQLVTRDDSHRAGGTITVGHEIRKLALVSDNEAFNRLYELVGQDGLARSLGRAGLTEPRIVHRLSEPRTAAENLRSPRIDFVGAAFSFTLPERVAPPLAAPPAMPGLSVGAGYLAGESRVDQPMDFTPKNRMSLIDLQRGLCKLVRPDVDCGGGPPFALDAADREFLLEAMTAYPRQSADPVLDPAEYPDAWGKRLLPGLERVIPPARLRVVSKYGEAYGFTTDNAWIEDRSTGRGLFIAATIYTNADGVLNDDVYEYRDVAQPFFTALGEAVARRLTAAP